MDRRSFLSGGTAAALAPLLGRHQPSLHAAPEGPHWLLQAAERARALGKPLLALNPTEPRTIWSHFLAYGKDLELYPLAACEIVCATRASLIEAFSETEERPRARMTPAHPMRAEHISMHAPSILRWVELAKEIPTHLVHAMAEAVRCKAWHQDPPGARWMESYDDAPLQSRISLEFLTSAGPK